LRFIDYFDYQIKKSKLETIDLNILYNGVEIYPAGTRLLGPDVDNRIENMMKIIGNFKII